MTNQERMLAAVRREPVDRIPYGTYNCHPYVGSHHMDDPSYREIMERVESHASAMIKVGVRGNQIWAPERLERRLEGDGDERVIHETLHTPRGDLYQMTRSPVGKPGMRLRHFVQSDDDIERYLSLPYEPAEIDATPARELVESVAGRALVCVMFSEAMHPAASLFDFDDFALRCATDMAALKRMVAWHAERLADVNQRLIDACRGMEVVLHTGGPELCTPPMVSPRVFGELVTPELTRTVARIHDAGLLAGVHCHGRVREVLPEIIAAGVDVLEPVEPPEQGNITLAELMAEGGGRITFMGYVQDQDFYSAPPGYMTRWVEGVARTVEGRTGYIMIPTCTPFEHPCTDVYARNYCEWLDAAERVFQT